MRPPELATLLLLLLLLLCVCACAEGGSSSDDGAPARPTTSADFVPLALSDLAPLAGALPTVHPATPVDTSGWSVFDVTTVGRTDPDGPGPADFRGCESIVPGGPDNSAALECMFLNSGERALLRFPDGDYDFDTGRDVGQVFRPRPAYQHRGIVCDSRRASLRLTGTDFRTGGERVQLLEGDEPVWNAPATEWNGGAGATRGATVIQVASTAGFSTVEGADGQWVVLAALPNALQDDSLRRYAAKVVAIGPGSITIDRPLPDEFDGGDATARAWNPTRGWVVRGCHIVFTEPEHQANNASWAIRYANMVESEISDVHVEGAYRSAIQLSNTARTLVASSDITDSAYDKGPNSFALDDGGGSDNTWVDLHTHNVVTAFACTGSTQGAIVAFNDFRGMDPNPAWDPFCDDDDPIDGLGDANDCDVVAIEAAHAAVHAPVLPDDPNDSPDLGPAWFHCSTIDRGDARGLNGGGSCQGTRAGAVYSTAEWHDSTCSNSVFMRNYVGGGSLWFDTAFGPGVGNFFFGNVFVPGVPEFDVSPGRSGSFHVLDSGLPPPGYGRTDVWANNVVDIFGSGLGYDAMGRGVQVHDNVIRTACFSNPAPGEDADGADCAGTNSGGAYFGRNTVWANNTVGADDHGPGYTRRMPSAPGLPDWPDWAVVPASEAPFVGPEMGDPDANPSCLPAAERWYGGCP